MDRFESMSLLLTVVEAGSLSAAARRLDMPLATVSRKVSELETHLKTRLFNRSSRHITLTDEGRSYVAACKRILEDLGEAERAASGEFSAPKGDLIITAPIVFGRLHVLPIVIEFLRTYPDIDIRIALADRVPTSWKSMSISRSGSASCRTAVWSRAGSARSAASSARARHIWRSAARRKPPANSACTTASRSREWRHPTLGPLRSGSRMRRLRFIHGSSSIPPRPLSMQR
jgi:DNA-binding transcriptional LysR family regulator